MTLDVERLESLLNQFAPRVTWRLQLEDFALSIKAAFSASGAEYRYHRQVPLLLMTRYGKRLQDLAADLILRFSNARYGIDEPLQTIVVLGCPRSGTSLVAGILHKSGVDMGARFHTGYHPANPAGFYENNDFANANETLLHRLGIDYLTPLSEEEVASIPYHDEVFRLFVRNAQNAWGWKCPRTVTLWPLYEPLLKGLNPHIIICHRNVYSIAQSWIASGYLDDFHYALWFAGWFEQRLSDIAKNATCPVLHLAFEDWWYRFDAQALALSEFVGRTLDFGHFDEALRRS